MRKIFCYSLLFLLLMFLLVGCEIGSTNDVSDEGKLPVFKDLRQQEYGDNSNISTLSLSEIKFHIIPQYDFVSENIDGIMRSEKRNGDAVAYGFIDSNGSIITDTFYEDSKFYIGASSASSGFSEGLAPVKKNGKWGYIDDHGKVKIDFRYDDAMLFNDGIAQAVQNNKYGYIDKKGEFIINPIFEYGSEFHNGIAVVQSDSKYGFINKEGKWLISPIYDSIDFGRWDYYWTNSNMVQIEENGLKGIARIVNEKVKIIIQPKYSKIFPFSNGEAKFVLMDKDSTGEPNENNIQQGFINEAGEEICKWTSKDGTDYQYMSEGLRQAQNKENKRGFTDKYLNLVIPYRYDDIGGFIDGLAIVVSDGKTGLIDKTGKPLLPFEYDMVVSHKDEGYVVVGDKNGKHLVNITEFKAISAKYDEIFDGTDILPVKKNGKIGFIDKKGKELAAPEFDDYNTFYSGGIWVKANEKWIFVDRNGIRQFPESYDEVSLFVDGLASVKYREKWGVIDLKGNMKVPFLFDKTSTVGGGLVKVVQNEKYGFIKVQ